MTTQANINFSNAITDGAVAGTVNSMAISGSNTYIADGYLRLVDETGTVTIPSAERAGAKDAVTVSFKKGWGNKNGMGSGFRMKDADGEVIVNFQFARWDGSSTNTNNLNIDMSGLYGSAYNNAPINDRYTTFTITVDYAAKKITSVVSCTNPNASQTFYATLTNTNPIATFEAFAYGVSGNPERADMFDDLLIQTTEGDYTTSTADYTVNWKLAGEDTPVKSEVRVGDVGDDITLDASDKASFWVSTQKYIYVSDDLTDQTVLEDGSAVVNITVREAATFNYTVNAVDGSSAILEQVSSSSTQEGESVYFFLPTAVLKDETLYFMTAENSYKSVAVTSDNQVFPYAYTASTVDNVVFFVEGESISGAATSNPAPNQQLASRGYMGRGTNLTVTTLPAGSYTVYVRYINTNNGDHSVVVQAGGVEVINNGTLRNRSTINGSVTLTESTSITLTAGGSGTSGVDYLYIVKTGESATIGSTGYTTFASPYALNLDALPSGLEAYYITSSGVNAEYVTLTAATGNVPAGTGLILKGDAGSYNIPVATSGTALSGNLLVGCTAATAVTADANKYVLVANAGVAEFQSLATNAANVPAGKAYLSIPGGGAKARLSILLDGDATAIAAPAVAEAEDDAPVYNVAGQRVAANYKGIVIKNGKKYLNK